LSVAVLPAWSDRGSAPRAGPEPGAGRAVRAGWPPQPFSPISAGAGRWGRCSGGGALAGARGALPGRVAGSRLEATWTRPRGDW